MIAITLGTLMVATVATIYLSQKSAYQLEAALSRLQENARAANYYLSKELRMAGLQGCGAESYMTITNRVKNPSNQLTYTNPLKGYDGLSNSFSPTLPSNVSSLAYADSDVIETRRGDTSNVQLNDDMDTTTNTVSTYNRITIQPGDALIINDCSRGDIFIASSGSSNSTITHTATDNTSSDLSTPYVAGSQISPLVYYAFYVKNTGRVNAQNQPIYALVRQDLKGNEVELAEGVEKMRISYGVDNDADNAIDLYQTATQVNSSNNWGNVIAFKINLLFATTDNVYSKPQSYQFNGTSYTPTDLKARREWTNVITIRNRGLPT